MENFLDEKIKEMHESIGVISFKKGGDNYERLKRILIETYKRGVEGEPLTIEDNEN